MSREIDVLAIAPMLWVSLGVVVVPLLGVVLARKETLLSAPLTRERAGAYVASATLAFLVAAFLATVNGFLGEPRVFDAANPMIEMDGFAHFLNGVVLVAAALTVLASTKYTVDMDMAHAEYYVMILSSVAGMLFLTSATDLMMLFLALELMSIPLYVLAGIRRTSLRSNESAIKYFLIGSFASGILLYGSALLYGATGSLALREIGASFDPESPVALLGAALMLVGLAFKIASVPFHQWAPDTYEGAPTTVSGFMATAVKVAAFGALVRVVVLALYPAADLVRDSLWLIAVLTMTVGNVMAILQQNMKRLLAYSSVAHAGYLLVGVVAGTEAGRSAVLFYLVVYTFMSLGAFSVVAILARDGEERDRVDDLAGLAWRRPFLAAVMAICMFSLAGIPGFGGFWGKFYVFMAAIQQGTALGDSSLFWLAIVGVLNSVLSLAYYLRVPVVMYMHEPTGEVADRSGTFERVVLLTCAAATLLLGIVPGDVFVFFGDLDLLRGATLAAASLAP